MGAGARWLIADRRNLLIVALLGLTLGCLYFVAIDLHDPRFSFAQQQNVISGAAGSPYRYRVLVPFLLQAGVVAFDSVGSPQQVFLDASFVYDVVGLSLQMVVLYVWFRQFFTRQQSLLGLAFAAGLTVLTIAYFTFQPWSILEVVFFAVGFILARNGHWGWVGAVVVIASFNRETGVFLPLALLLASLSKDWRHPSRQTKIAFAYCVLSTAIFAGLRLVRGSADPVDPLAEVLRRNLDRNNLIAAAWGVLLFLGFAWPFALLGLRSAPPFVRRLARVIPVYLVAFAIWGWWREVRILTSLYPILVPLALSYVSFQTHPRAATCPLRQAND
jgi:branched-subunit amino acid transport protein AzlD